MLLLTRIKSIMFTGRISEVYPVIKVFFLNRETNRKLKVLIVADIRKRVIYQRNKFD